ncbi:hypothetical protein GLOIN_2v1882676 [Rhizophagus clarus]|uniref:TLDc domain-containing protein n=1 Tax=Rhizophagus clarus TaxID=94130 RepID=A0A8H3LRW2_9GLOM|nr:hypothetical protein GLOIN_2v1882676 [Rhizophagus clarus]
MSTQFFSKLSQNYIEILDDNEYHDVNIEVGEDPNKDNNTLVHIKLSNISPEIFQIILRYLYGGIISLDGQDPLDIFKILIAADSLLLRELVDYLQTHFIEKEIEWMEQRFEFIYRTSFQSHNLSEIQKFCIDFMAKFPEKIFKSLDFTSLPEKFLISLIKKDDLQMKEIEVWEYVLKWGLAQNQTINPDPDTWTDNDYEMMKNTLRNCLPLIRFFSLSSKEFLHKVSPYKKLLKQQVCKDLLNSYMDPDIEPNNDNIPLPRNLRNSNVIESKIVNLNIISTISRWIDKVDFNVKFSYLRELYLPFKFDLLLSGSRDGFSAEKFHKLCDNKLNTIIFIKVKGTGEILGGHNPSIWKSSIDWGQSYYSFIFSFKSKNKIKDSVLSRIKNINRALNYEADGPSFGGDDIKLSFSFLVYACKCRCIQTDYEKKIRDNNDWSHVEDYEVFQITKT